MQIDNYIIGGIDSGITCTPKGIFYPKCEQNEVLLVWMYYPERVTETAVSLKNIVSHHSSIIYSLT